MSEPEARSRTGGYFCLGPKIKTEKPPTEMPGANGPIHIECSIMPSMMASGLETELGYFSKIAKRENTSELPCTPVTTDRSAAQSIVNAKVKQKRLQAIGMRFYWVRDRTRQNHFQIFWEPGKKNLANYFTEHHPTYHHRAMRTKYLKPTLRDVENAIDTCTGPMQGCVGTDISGAPVELGIPK